MRYLSVDEVVELHRRNIERFGGSYGLRDPAMLESAVVQPLAAFGGQELYPTLASKAAALAFSLVNNHPFVDGNKRTGFAAMAVFLRLNGMDLVCSADEGERTVIAVASSQMSRDRLCEWVEGKMVAIADPPASDEKKPN